MGIRHLVLPVSAIYTQPPALSMPRAYHRISVNLILVCEEKHIADKAVQCIGLAEIEVPGNKLGSSAPPGTYS
jgi:hypothetical protein